MQALTTDALRKEKAQLEFGELHKVSASDCKWLAAALLEQKRQTVRAVTVAEGAVGGDGLRALLPLCAATKLRQLAVRKDQLGIDGSAAQFARDFLAQNPPLQHLDLSFCRLREGAATLCQGLARGHNARLHTLLLAGNVIGDAAFADMADALSTNSSLTSLSLSVNVLSSKSAPRLARLLEQSATTIRDLDVSWNNFGLGGVRRVLGALRSPRNLVRSLIVGGNQVSYTDIVKLRHEFEACTYSEQGFMLRVLEGYFPTSISMLVAGFADQSYEARPTAIAFPAS